MVAFRPVHCKPESREELACIASALALLDTLAEASREAHVHRAAQCGMVRIAGVNEGFDHDVLLALWLRLLFVMMPLGLWVVCT